MCALIMAHSVTLTEQYVLMWLVTMGKTHSTAHSMTGGKQILQLDQDYMLTSPLLAAEHPNFISTISN